MTPQEAYKIVISKVPNREPISCFEWGDYYIFGTVSKEYPFNGPTFDSAYAVNKKDNRVSIFNPAIQQPVGEKIKIEIFK